MSYATTMSSGNMQGPPPVEAKCTICGHSRTFYSWDGRNPSADNVNFAQSTGLIEAECWKCGVKRAFQKVQEELILEVVYECFNCGAEVPMGYDEEVTGVPEEAHIGKVIEGICLKCKSNKIWVKEGQNK